MNSRSSKTILILGGTAEGASLARKLSRQPQNRVISSLAGRTDKPFKLPGEVRIGGFGGVVGLANYLKTENIDELVDATHPFARQISQHAKKACELVGVKRTRINRPPWTPHSGDNWQSVADIAEAANTLPAGAKVFLALGSQRLDAFFGRDDVYFTVRMVDAPAKVLPFKHLSLVLGLPSKSIAAERTLFQEHNISHLVCRNSGGSRGLVKISAALELGIQIIMIERPK